MKTTTIEFDQFRDHLDQALAEVEQGELILTRQGKPWIVMRAASHKRDAKIPGEVGSHGESVSDSLGVEEDTVSLIGKSVSWVRNYLRETCTIPLEAMAFVDGKRVSDDFVLEQGQVLEFAEEEEDEEWAAQLHRSPEFWEMISSTQPRGSDSLGGSQTPARPRLNVVRVNRASTPLCDRTGFSELVGGHEHGSAHQR